MNCCPVWWKTVFADGGVVMIQQLYVSGSRFWQALSYCVSPVSLTNYKHIDLRILTDSQRETVIPFTQKESTAVSLNFQDEQDYIRFTLAYLLSENSE